MTGLYFALWLKDQGARDSALAIPTSIAMAIIMVLGPWVGARTDHSGRRLPVLVWGTAVTVVATAGLASWGVTISLILFVMALLGFNLAGIAYDSLLPDVSTDATIGRVSGLGVGIGYVGSFIAVGIGRIVFDVLDLGRAAVFRSLAAAFLILAIPSFFLMKERPRPTRTDDPPGLTKVFSHLIQSWKRARATSGVARFLVGRFLYTDAINTLIGGFLAIFATQDIGLTEGETEILLAVAIAAAVGGGFVASRLVDRVGPRAYLHAMLYIWIGALVVGMTAALTGTTWLAWILGGAGGVALGGVWASDRAYMALLTPRELYGEFYGLYGTVGRFATITGPLLWALVVDGFGAPRSVLVGLLALAVIGARVVLQGVPHA